MATGDIGIDLGTRNSLVYTTGRGMILSEPTVVVYDRNAERIRMIGEEAKSMADHSLSVKVGTQLLPGLLIIFPPGGVDPLGCICVHRLEHIVVLMFLYFL